MKQIAALFLLALLAVSCRKERPAADTSATRDHSLGEELYNDLLRVVHDLSEGTTGVRDYETPCLDAVTIDLESSPMSILADFGEDDCVGVDGKMRKGKILITYTGRYRDEGTVITITPDNYRVNGYLIEGVKTVTNLGLNGSGQPHFSIDVAGTITSPGNAYTLMWNSQRIRTWIAGSTTLTIWDDEYHITGSGNGTNRNGLPYTTQILTPLHVKLLCPWIVSGTAWLTPQGLPDRIINFGNGACNAGFTVTVEGQTYAIAGGN